MEQSDDKIIDMIREKDAKGLSELIDKYNSAICYFVQRILGDLAQREDIDNIITVKKGPWIMEINKTSK